MMHDRGVTAEAFSRDGELLATGSEDGKLKVWKLSTGLCLRRFDGAHSQSITSVAFSRDGTQLLTGSFDHLVRIHGLKSGQTLKEFPGHESYVNSAIFSTNGSRVISTSSDGTMKVGFALLPACSPAFVLMWYDLAVCLDLERQDHRVHRHHQRAKLISR